MPWQAPTLTQHQCTTYNLERMSRTLRQTLSTTHYTALQDGYNQSHTQYLTRPHKHTPAIKSKSIKHSQTQSSVRRHPPRPSSLVTAQYSTAQVQHGVTVRSNTSGPDIRLTTAQHKGCLAGRWDDQNISDSGSTSHPVD